MLSVYAQGVAPGILQVWVGVFGAAAPGVPRFELDGVEVAAEVVAPLRPIRDATKRNHRGVYRIPGTAAGVRYRLSVQVDAERFELPVQTLPAAVPAMLDGSFDILLCSCYSQPEDDAGLFGTTVREIQVQPDLTLMLGDQIYGDLPLLEDLPRDRDGIARRIGTKYLRNWASSGLGTGGLGSVLARAPVVCVPDDHEFWNNYPYKQAQLPTTWTEAGRRNWHAAALALYEDYQTAAAGAAQRIDVDPLKILAVDMRCARDARFERLVTPEALAAIHRWVDDLIAAKANGTPAFGVFASGQALFVAPQSESERESVDAEMSNYAQFEAEILPAFERLVDAGVPIVYVTGDVHWGRVAEGIDLRSGRSAIVEVIASPARLLRVPLMDSAKGVLNRLGVFGERDPWPRHSNPGVPPDRLGRHLRLECDPADGLAHRQRGDHVALLSFSRAGSGVDFTVSYYAITDDRALGRSRSTRARSLRVT